MINASGEQILTCNLLDAGAIDSDISVAGDDFCGQWGQIEEGFQSRIGPRAEGGRGHIGYTWKRKPDALPFIAGHEESFLPDDRAADDASKSVLFQGAGPVRKEIAGIQFSVPKELEGAEVEIIRSGFCDHV